MYYLDYTKEGFPNSHRRESLGLSPSAHTMILPKGFPKSVGLAEIQRALQIKLSFLGGREEGVGGVTSLLLCFNSSNGLGETED